MNLFSNSKPQSSNANKALTYASVFAGVAILILIIKATFSVFLLVFFSILIAILFRGAGAKIQKKTGWNSTLCLLIAIAIVVGFLFLMGWLVGSKVTQQIDQLTDALPDMLNKAKDLMMQNKFGKKALNWLQQDGSKEKIAAFAKQFFTSSFGFIGNVYVIFFLSLFLTAMPRDYIQGIIALIPPKNKEKAQLILKNLGTNLRLWLKGKMISMLVVAVFTAIGLAILGIQMWLVLALLAGLLSFIPNFGPVLALLPAVLVGFLDSGTTALLIIGIYLLVQALESNVVTPIVQKKLLSLPPAMVLVAQMIIGGLCGAMGVLVATPLLVVAIVLVNQLYVQRITRQLAPDEKA